MIHISKTSIQIGMPVYCGIFTGIITGLGSVIEIKWVHLTGIRRYYSTDISGYLIFVRCKPFFISRKVIL